MGFQVLTAANDMVLCSLILPLEAIRTSETSACDGTTRLHIP
jgi:hypothetical protein